MAEPAPEPMSGEEFLAWQRLRGRPCRPVTADIAGRTVAGHILRRPDLPAIGCSLPLAELYEGVPLEADATGA